MWYDMNNTELAKYKKTFDEGDAASRLWMNTDINNFWLEKEEADLRILLCCASNSDKMTLVRSQLISFLEAHPGIKIAADFAKDNGVKKFGAEYIRRITYPYGADLVMMTDGNHHTWIT